MNQHQTSTSNGQCSENARLRLKLSQERFAELLSDLMAFLPENTTSLEDSQGVPLSSLPPSGSQAA